MNINRKKLFVFLLLLSIVFLLFSCTLISVEDFYIVRMSIEENGIIGAGKEPIEIQFSDKIDENSVKDNVKIERDNGTEIVFQHNVLKDRLILTPEEEWAPHQRFWLVVSGELKDIHGLKMGRNFYLSFQSTVEMLPVSGIMVLPVVPGGIVETETYTLQIRFSSDVDKNSVERAFSISPYTKGYFEWLNNILLTYHFIDPLQKNTLYNVSISDEARDIRGFEIKPFQEDFEYFPSLSCPEVIAIYAGASKIFDLTDPLTFSKEGGKILVVHQGAEKDLAMRFDFSTPLDVISFRDNFSISPYTEWYEKWNPEGTVVNIYFNDNLTLEEKYEIYLGKGLKSKNGMAFFYEYMVLLNVDGPYSRFLKFYAPLFTDLVTELQDFELWKSGTLVEDGIADVQLLEPYENQNEGNALKVIYNESVVQKEDLPFLEIRWKIHLEFTHPYYVPVIDRCSLQDSVFINSIFGNSAFSGSIQSFTWEGDNVCILNVREMGKDSIYHLSIEGGKAGVIDENKNYIDGDVEYFFRVILSPD